MRISESCARYAGGPYMPVKWDDFINPKPQETRTPDEVKNYMLKKLRGENVGRT